MEKKIHTFLWDQFDLDKRNSFLPKNVKNYGLNIYLSARGEVIKRSRAWSCVITSSNGVCVLLHAVEGGNILVSAVFFALLYHLVIALQERADLWFAFWWISLPRGSGSAKREISFLGFASRRSFVHVDQVLHSWIGVNSLHFCFVKNLS